MMTIYLQADLLGNTKVGKSFELQNISPVDDDKPNGKVLEKHRNKKCTVTGTQRTKGYY